MRWSVLLLLVSGWLWAQDPCGDSRIWYVKPGGCAGGPGCGSRSNPADIYWARNQACAVATPTAPHVIRLATGNYTLNNTLELCSNVYWDGGYDESQQWKKTNAAKTLLNRTTANAEGLSLNNPQVPRLVGVRGENISNFQLHDININVQGFNPNEVHPNSRHGVSVYGIYLKGCFNYRIVRCDVTAGPGSRGADAPISPSRHGGNAVGGGRGGDGRPGPEVIGCFDGEAPGGRGGDGGVRGAGGIAANNPDMRPTQLAGNGGSGGRGGNGGNGRNGENCGPPGFTGWDGEIGGDGGAGGAGAVGSGGSRGSGGLGGSVAGGCGCCRGPSNPPGSAGTSGSSGAGGLSGASATAPFFDADYYMPNWGIGGSGGGGGAGGAGGYGGGGSFGIFLINNGPEGYLVDCRFVSSGGGRGGTGAPGGNGGSRAGGGRRRYWLA